MKCYEICRFFVRNFHGLGEIHHFLGFWSVSSPPGELKNLNIPIGISMISACGGQGTTRIIQKVIFASFYRSSRNSAENGEVLVDLGKITVFGCFEVFGGPSPSDLDFEQGIQRFREGSRNPGNQ